MIACFDAKYHYWFWRPYQAIPGADTDGNPDTTADPTWQPLATTPNFPEYPSAHACHSTAVVTALDAFFGTDQVPMTLDSRVTNTTRHYHRLHDIVTYVDWARVLVGFHFRTPTSRAARSVRPSDATSQVTTSSQHGGEPSAREVALDEPPPVGVVEPRDRQHLDGIHRSGRFAPSARGIHVSRSGKSRGAARSAERASPQESLGPELCADAVLQVPTRRVRRTAHHIVRWQLYRSLAEGRQLRTLQQRTHPPPAPVALTQKLTGAAGTELASQP